MNRYDRVITLVSLNGADSKLIFPGEFDSINPKSIWIICPIKYNISNILFLP
jgi:hypothetical protein